MSNSSNVTSLCDLTDRLCVARVYEQEVIVVPALLLGITLGTLLALCCLQLCSKNKDDTDKTHSHHHTRQHHSNTRQNSNTHHHSKTQHQCNTNHNSNTHQHSNTHHNSNTQHQSSRHHRSSRQHLQGIDAPPELNPLEYEVVPMTDQTRSQRPQPAVPPVSAERQQGSFQLITPLPLSFAVKPNSNVALYRATMDRRPVVLRVLNETANARERKSFLGFARFLSELGPHPCLPALLGVVTVSSPLITVIEELDNRDLLSFLWRCRQDHQTVELPCDLTEKRIFTMGGQVASALEFLHSKNCIHGNIGARSVLVGRDLSVKLWGLGPAFRMSTEAGTAEEVEEMELRKWQAPEVLARRPVSHSSDIWSFGILLFEMVTLGDPPFPRIMASELLQYLQRGKTLKRQPNCSNSLYSIMKDCCQWRPQERLSLTEVISKLKSGERNANDTVVLRVPEALDIGTYMREAGYGESFNYAVV